MEQGAQRTWRLVIMLGIVLTCVATTNAQAQKIPEVHSASFSGAQVSLPQALRGKVGILVIGFNRGATDALTVWGTRLAADYLQSHTVLYYELPVLASVPKLARGFVTSRIKASVADAGKPHFITITEDEAAWRTLVHYQTPDDAYVLLVDGQGNVRWQVQGSATDASYRALKQQVAALQQPSTVAPGR